MVVELLRKLMRDVLGDNFKEGRSEFRQTCRQELDAVIEPPLSKLWGEQLGDNVARGHRGLALGRLAARNSAWQGRHGGRINGMAAAGNAPINGRQWERSRLSLCSESGGK